MDLFSSELPCIWIYYVGSKSTPYYAKHHIFAKSLWIVMQEKGICLGCVNTKCVSVHGWVAIVCSPAVKLLLWWMSELHLPAVVNRNENLSCCTCNHHSNKSILIRFLLCEENSHWKKAIHLGPLSSYDRFYCIYSLKTPEKNTLQRVSNVYFCCNVDSM